MRKFTFTNMIYSNLKSILPLKKVFFTFFLFLSLIAHAQSVSIDKTFNPIDNGGGHGVASSAISSIALQPDGKSVLVGSFIYYNGVSVNKILRLKTDGSLDTSFNPEVVATDLFTIVLQPDGKMIVGGNFSTFSSVIHGITRLNSDGSLDTSFNSGFVKQDLVYSMALQPDGKVLVGGKFTTYDGVSRNRIVRLNSDGSLDTSFDPGVGTQIGEYSIVHSIALQPDGKVLIGGEFSAYNGVSRNKIARLNSDGSIDNTFNSSAGANGTVNSIVLQLDGKVIIGGEFTSYNGVARYGVARLNSNGSLDNSFDSSVGVNGKVKSLALQQDGKMFIGGEFVGYNGKTRNCIARLNSDGTLDAIFNPGTGAKSANLTQPAYIRTIVIQPDGKIIVVGIFDNYNQIIRNGIARLNSDGKLDRDFDLDTGPNLSVTTLADKPIIAVTVQPDGKVLIGGRFSSYNGVKRDGLARLNSDGTLDTGFSGNLYSQYSSPSVGSIILQPDGKIIVLGGFTSYNNVKCGGVVRLNPDGSLDTTFKFNYEFSGGIGVLQPDGKLLINGFTNYNDIYYSGIARLNSDGSLDTSFDPGTNTNNSDVRSIVLQPNGKIIISGYFSQYNGIQRVGIARLNSDGSLDITFKPDATDINGNFRYVQSIVLQPDGKLLTTKSVEGFSERYISRLNSNGSLDTSFDAGSNANHLITSMALQPDGKVIIGGNFTLFNGVPSNRLARLNSDGSLDTSFDVGFGPSNWVDSIYLQQDGKIIIGGRFRKYNEVGRNYLTRLNIDQSLGTLTPNIDLVSSNFDLIAYPNPYSSNFSLKVSSKNEENISVFVYDMLGREIDKTKVPYSDVKGLKLGYGYPKGIYNVIVSQGIETRVLKMIKL